ncbi:hypothetical protein QSU92_12365 [Microbacterium sp. ET2]|uniref:hypothetical protein n=1 Tax=Microbacterium albipurpureum TaxID=3050384 RepID=UPI00259CA6C5|nr:hypothetical protein [Microbacterium sp. ET2 (Ac-2212)]WJL94757.1 hypothetical protein QSU92_12365 [Microbacterium sp. ET2 (Ac-2212)]
MPAFAALPTSAAHNSAENVARHSLQFKRARWMALGLLGILALTVIFLSVLALGRLRGDVVAQPNPVPSFSLGIQTQTPTPTAEPPGSAVQVSPGQERFFSVGEDAWWRGTAGRCGVIEPLVERSVDGGQTWLDVTPRYLEIGELLSLNPFTPTEAEMVVRVGPGCELQALRTYTQGRFWESYPDVLANSRYIDSADSATVDLGANSIPAPCGSAFGLRSSGDLVALLCDGSPSVSNGDGWRGLAAQGAIAVAFDGRDLLVAHTSAACQGTTVSRFPAESPDAPVLVGCISTADPALPAALEITDGVPVLWSAEQILAPS